jgi:hypothetical protein
LAEDVTAPSIADVLIGKNIQSFDDLEAGVKRSTAGHLKRLPAERIVEAETAQDAGCFQMPV